MNCEFCPTGTYQPLDNKEGKKEIIKDCLKCGPGNYARKIRDFSHFETIGLEIFPFCSDTNDVGSL